MTSVLREREKEGEREERYWLDKSHVVGEAVLRVDDDGGGGDANFAGVFDVV